ncbi:MAG TPA: LysM peptidoglycan-binding domain-containing protein, partial [Patescibacteria group bacterium]|nr:LysM peptidoglycan-binding domain-containing protein [Patescibacteria group bacterium]
HSTSLAVKIAPDGSIDILQGPEAKTPPGKVSIAAVKYDDKGRLSVTGMAKPKSHVQIYMDNQSIGHAFADEHGRWKLTRPLAVNGGNHTVRADQLGPDGKVRERAEIAFSPSGTLPSEGKITVESGASLWRLARKAYGSGFDYLVIYQANKDQIRDPDRIYPGQVFNLPPQH